MTADPELAPDIAAADFLAAWQKSRARRRRRDAPYLVGAAVGTGLAAKAAVRGGCDFLLATNVAKLRSMGAGAMAALLPISESNDVVFRFGAGEVLPQREATPVFFGACCFDPRLDLTLLVDEVAKAGYRGIFNFPTSTQLDRRFRLALDRVGAGFSREVDLLRCAKRAGLTTMGCVASLAEALDMIDAGVDIISFSLGWTTQGFSGLQADLQVDDAADGARFIFREVRKRRKDMLCFVAGGPIINPDDMHMICETAAGDGYIGTAIDTQPLENAVIEAASSFKAISRLERRRRRLEAPEHHGIGPAIVGWSDAAVHLRRECRRLARSAGPILISGPAGAGKKLAGQRVASERRSASFVTVPCDEWLEQRLFGTTATGGGSTMNRIGLLEADAGTALYLDGLEAIPRKVQRSLALALDAGRFFRIGDPVARTVTVHMLFSSRLAGSELDRERFDPRLFDMLAGREIRVPSLAERIEDVPLLARYFITQCLPKDSRPRISGDLYASLMAQDWPNNIGQLKSVLEAASAIAQGHAVSADHVRQTRSSADHGTDEKHNLLDALRRHRFHRGQTAAFLGICRKTLYNRMRVHGITRLGLR
nr:phosphoenolpyruvate hydrolase family protein [Sphingomonas sp. Y57]